MSGDLINSEGSEVNVVDLLLSKGATADPLYSGSNLNNTLSPMTGNMVASDGSVYNIVDLITTLNMSSGTITASSIPTNNGSNTQQELTTLSESLDLLKGVVEGLEEDQKDYLSKSYTSTQEMSGALQITDQLDIKSHSDSGSLQFGFSAGEAYIATNNGLSMLSKVHMSNSTTTSDTTSYALATPDTLMRKQQVAQAISEVTGTHFSKWVTMGVPEDLTITSSWSEVYIPATTRFPNLPPEDIQPNEAGTGFVFQKAGLIHIKRNVSLGIQLYRNIKYQARINGQILDPLYPQTVDQGTMTYNVEFFWQVTANQELTIWAASQNDDVPLNYLGVTTLVEYL